MNLKSRWELTLNIPALTAFDCFYVGLQVENIITACLLTGEIKQDSFDLRSVTSKSFRLKPLFS